MSVYNRGKNPELHSKWGRFASWYLKLGEKNTVRYADEVIVLSEAMKKYFRDTYGRETVFLPNSVTRRDFVHLTWDKVTEKTLNLYRKTH